MAEQRSRPAAERRSGPASDRFAYLDHGGVLAFSHRGGNRSFPENTMPAFQHSVDLGYRYLETDVHLSADGVLYAFHDSSLARTTGVDADIGDLAAAEIDRLVVSGVAPIPRFEEVLTTWPHARLNVDTKSDASVLPLIEMIRTHGVVDRICIGSFSDRRIQLCRDELGPDLCTSMGPFETFRLFLASKGLADPSLLVAPCAQIPLRKIVALLTPRLLEVAHECGIQVHVWTINDVDEMHRVVDLGVDGIMTDDPRRLRDVLIERDAWAGTTSSRHEIEVSYA